MNSRERVINAINHIEPDRTPLDLGACAQTGINASTLFRLRKALALPERPVCVHEPYQLLGFVEEDVRKALGVDVVGLWNPVNFMGFANDGWKSWKMPDGTPVLIGGGFEFDIDVRGNTLAFPGGDRSVSPSCMLPQGGYFFDTIDRSTEYDEKDLDARRDFSETYNLFDEATCLYFERESKRLYEETEYAVLGNIGGGGFGDVAVIPGPYEKNPRGIRKIEDWYMAHILHPGYIHELFEMQKEIALKNLEMYRQAVGERIQIVYISGTDFGMQTGELISPAQYREFYMPYQKALNDWVHANTGWKTFYHCCGSIVNLLDSMAEAGIDILNPVQCSAAGMDPVMLKEKYGDVFVFWGGGVDTQRTLPFGTPDSVRDEVKSRLEIFSKGGGYMFTSIHNIQGGVVTENLMAMFEAFRNHSHS